MDENKLKASILDNINEFLCVVFDQYGTILYPNDLKSLKKYISIIDNPPIENNIYYNNKTNEWYERYDKQVINENGNILNYQYYRNITKFRELEQILMQDHATNLYNRQATMMKIDEYILYALSNYEEFSVILSDIDNFKTINDTYGHIFGDIVLKNIGGLINQNVRHELNRDNDIAGRFGGDEFFGLLRKSTQSEAEKWTCRISKKAREIIHQNNDGSTKVTNVGISIGMYHVSHKDIDEFINNKLSIEEIRNTIFERCDQVLYDIKEQHHKDKSKTELIRILK